MRDDASVQAVTAYRESQSVATVATTIATVAACSAQPRSMTSV
ncbi:hypothetical protein ACQVTS_32465 [Bacillus mycoides]